MENNKVRYNQRKLTPSWVSPYMLLFYLIFFIVIIFFIIYPYVWGGNARQITFTEPFSEVLNNFAQTITHKDLLQNAQLFYPGATIDFSKLMSWLPTNPILIPEWVNQMDVFQGEMISNHMILTNHHNVDIDRVDVIGLYTYTLDTIGNNTNLPTIMASFIARFTFINNLISSAEILHNATSTFLWYSSTGVDGTPVIPMAKKSIIPRAIPDMQRWDIILNQIDRLLDVGQRNTGLSICNTTQFLILKSMFDPMGTDPNNKCNIEALESEITVPLTCSGNGGIDNSCLPTFYEFLNVTTLDVSNLTCPMGPIVDDDMCFPQRIATINLIPAHPPTDDFTLVGGPGIEVTGLVNGLTIRNLGVLGIIFNGKNPIVNATLLPNQVLVLAPLPQPPNTVYAGPESGMLSDEPSFRQIISDDILNISASKITGILPVESGGTGSGIPLLGDRIMISFNNTIIEGPPIFDFNGTGGLIQAGDGIVIDLVNSTYVITASPRITSIDLNVPVDIFTVTSSPIIDGPGILTFTVDPQSANTFWAGPVSGMNSDPMFRLIVNDDLPNNISISKLEGILPVEKGGTNSGDSLINDKIMVSSGGKIVEAMSINGTGLTFDVTSGVITINNEGLLSASLSMPSDIFTVTGSPTVGNNGAFTVTKKTQSAMTFLAGPVNGVPAIPTFRAMNTLDLPPLNDGELYIGSGGQATIATLTAGTNIMITQGPGTIIISSNTTGGGIGGNATVSSVGLSLPTDLFTVTGSPVITTGTLTGTLKVQGMNEVWAGPATGGSGVPDFRLLVEADMPVLPNGQVLIGTGTGMVGASLTAGSGIMITEGSGSITIEATTLGTVTSIGITTPSFLNVSPSSITSSGTFSFTLISQSENTFFAAPDGSAGIPTCRSMAIRDLPQLSDGQLYIGSTGSPMVAATLSAGTGISITTGAGSIMVESTALVSSVALSLPASTFSISGSPVTSTGTLTGNFIAQTANTIFAGPGSGPSAIPTWRTLVTGDLPPLGNGEFYIGNLGIPTVSTISAGTGITVTPGPGTLTVSNAGVTSVALSLPSIFTVSGSPVTTTGTLTGTLQTQIANTIFAGPTSGPAAQPTFRNMVEEDLPALANGELYIGNAGLPTISTLTAGAGISITNGPGSIVIANTGGTGTVTSVGLSLPGIIFGVTGSPVTTSGTLTASLNTQTANTIFAGPTSGVPSTPTFRSLTPPDLPPLLDGELYIGNGGTPTVASLTAGSGITITPGAGSITIASTAGSGTVTSVALSLPASVFSVSGSPVTTSGTLTGTLNTQSANTVFAGPTSGGAATPTFRALTSADIPAPTSLNYFEATSVITQAGISSGTYTLITSMTLTPPAGTYQVNFSASGEPSASSGFYDYVIFNGVNPLLHSERTVRGQNVVVTMYTQGVVVANGVDSISVQIRKFSGSGSIDIYERSLFLLRIG